MEADYNCRDQGSIPEGLEASSPQLVRRSLTYKELDYIDRELQALNQGEEEFMPLPVCHLVHFPRLPSDVYIKTGDHETAGGRFSLIWPKGQVFTGRDWPAPGQAGETVCYLPSAEVNQILQHFLEFLSRDLTSVPLSPLGRGRLISDVMQLWITNFYLRTAAQHAEQYQLGAALVGRLYDLLKALPNPYGQVMDLRRPDPGIQAHCLNVCLIGLAFVYFLGYTASISRVFGLGALLHDFGMVPLARRLSSQYRQLSPEELLEIKSHPHRGYQILRKINGIPQEVSLMVLLHHENMDGSGYPLGLKDFDIHPWARILRLLDSYESITACRPWRPAFPPERALSIIKTAWKAKPDYDPHFIRFFIMFLEEVHGRRRSDK